MTWISGASALKAVTVNATPASSDAAIRIWVPAGHYNVELRSVEGAILSDRAISIEGARIAGNDSIAFSSSGYRWIRVGGVPVDANLLVFVNRLWPGQNAQKITYKPISALRGQLRIPTAGDVEVTHLNDGNWILVGNGRTLVGTRCDLLNSCFVGVSPGVYQLLHRYPPPLVAGIGLTALALLISLASLLLAGRSRREAAP